jgi:hypothetical protein
MDNASKARLEKISLTKGVSQGEVMRTAFAEYVDNYDDENDKKFSDVAAKKRIRIMKMMQPKDMHDGAMMIDTIDKVIKKEIKVLKDLNMLEADDYGHFIELIEFNKEACAEYENGEWVCKKLDILIDRLKEERDKKEGD